MKNYFLILSLAIFVVSCVPARKYEDEKASKASALKRTEQLEKQNAEIAKSMENLKESYEKQGRTVDALIKDTAEINSALRRFVDRDRINQIKMEELNRTNERILGTNLTENQRLMNRIDEQKKDLEKQKAELERAQKELAGKEEIARKNEADLNILKEKLDNAKVELEKREQKVNELQSILTRKDSIVNALQRTVNNALLSFSGNNDLKVEQRNGKVYVSLSEQLLFKSGSTSVDVRGKQALKELSKVLDKNPDINVTVEGHTDDVPYRGTGQISDNWDLSVLRATTIVKILLEGSNINPTRISANGRGEYFPIENAKTPEARKVNRRTEIILTPKLDDLFKILNNN